MAMAYSHAFPCNPTFLVEDLIRIDGDEIEFAGDINFFSWLAFCYGTTEFRSESNDEELWLDG